MQQTALALGNLRLELRRGCLVLAVLAALREERYGYTLRKFLAERGLDIDEGTLYPLLRRLEAQQLLVSEWREHEKRNKRFYRLSPGGESVLNELLADWRGLDTSIRAVLNEPAAGVTRRPDALEGHHGSDTTLPASG